MILLTWCPVDHLAAGSIKICDEFGSPNNRRKEQKMAVQAKAEGNGPATGMQKTPAPDAISTPRSGTGQGYGANGPVGNASSVEPGKRVLSPLAQNLESSVDDDGVLSRVIREGTAR